jgi:hypothetical protein
MPATDGRSVLAAMGAEPVAWADELLYEYYWEHAFPHTPTVFALRENRFKYIYYHGVWDTNELFDLATDPQERHNLIALPEHAARVDSMRVRLFERLGATDGMSIPLKPAGPWQAAERKRN